MAKIIDLKTRKVIADMPTEKQTARIMKGYATPDSKLLVVAPSEGSADAIYTFAVLVQNKKIKQTA